MSIEPPAPNGIRTRIGLVGQGSAARAGEPDMVAAQTPPAVAASGFRLVSGLSIVCPPKGPPVIAAFHGD
jgi:hypothetical protein